MMEGKAMFYWFASFVVQCKLNRYFIVYLALNFFIRNIFIAVTISSFYVAFFQTWLGHMTHCTFIGRWFFFLYSGCHTVWKQLYHQIDDCYCNIKISCSQSIHFVSQRTSPWTFVLHNHTRSETLLVMHQSTTTPAKIMFINHQQNQQHTCSRSAHVTKSTASRLDSC